MAVIVASDLTHRSQAALRRGADLARILGRPLHVIHVVSKTLSEGERRAAIEGGKAILERSCAGLGAPAVIEVSAGDARQDIARYALDCGGTLMVVGLHDESKDGLFWRGDSTTTHIIHSSPLPVLIVTGDGARPYRKAVVGVDFSVFSRSAIRHAAEIAPDASLHLVHAYQVPFRLRLGSEAYLNEVQGQARQAFDDFMAEDMKWLMERASSTGVTRERMTPEVMQGMPFEVLTGTVRRDEADLVVIGTHGSNAVTEAFWGSVAGALLEAPPCDLLVVHAV